jgi:hypothetical protein
MNSTIIRKKIYTEYSKFPILDISGLKFGKLIVINLEKKQGKLFYWNCICECGAKRIVSSNNLRNKTAFSCGKCIKKNKKHGHKTRLGASLEYSSWVSMKNRCYNKNTNNYSLYGGRGIAVCDRWLNSFENFLEDMGNRPSKKHSLDRINVNGNYEPSNCRWATKYEQLRNQRTNVHLCVDGVVKIVADWAKVSGTSFSTIHSRIKRGFTDKECVYGKKNKKNEQHDY